MKKNKMNIVDIIQLTMFMLFVFLWFISSKLPSLRYISIGIFGCFCIIQSIKIFKRKKIVINTQIISYAIFTIFTGLSFIWAIDQKLVFSKLFDLICNCIFLIMSYDFFINLNMKKENIIKVFMMIGFIFSLYVMLYYGFFNYFNLLLAGKRLGYEIINVNFVGMVGSLTFIIATYMLINSQFKHKIFGIFVLFTTLSVSLGSGSKKSILCILIGFTCIMILQFKEKLTYKKIIKITILLLTGYIFLKYIYNSPYFSTVFVRINNMINTLEDESIIVGSTYIRKQFIKYGFETFLNHPLLGIGLNNSSYITYIITNSQTYLHCNYVELLACTGIIGFLLYYYIYFKSLTEIIKEKNLFSNITSIILITMLVLDIGVVSYYEIRCSMYLLLCFILNNKK